jgi:hypothetical protein
MMTLFANSVLLRGFLAKDAEAPSSDHIQNDAFAVLLLATVSGKWDISACLWIPLIDRHRIICPGPFFCVFTRGMKRGDYLEIEGEIREAEEARASVPPGKVNPRTHSTYAVYAQRITRLDRPDYALVGFGEDG